MLHLFKIRTLENNGDDPIQSPLILSYVRPKNTLIKPFPFLYYFNHNYFYNMSLYTFSKFCFKI